MEKPRLRLKIRYAKRDFHIRFETDGELDTFFFTSKLTHLIIDRKAPIYFTFEIFMDNKSEPYSFTSVMKQQEKYDEVLFERIRGDFQELVKQKYLRSCHIYIHVAPSLRKLLSALHLYKVKTIADEEYEIDIEVCETEFCEIFWENS
jgi:hypothetical protein